VGTRGDVARQSWQELLPTAYLLTGDRAAARGLVVRTLADRQARPDHDALVDLLVRTHRRRRWAGQVTVSGEDAAPWWASPADVADAHDLAARLDQLDPDARAAVVLRWWEDRSPDQVAALLPGTDLDALARQLPADLPRRLSTLAGMSGATALDDDLVATEVRAHRGRRARRAVLAVGAVGALAAGAVLAPSGAPAPTAPAATATRTTPPPTGLAAEPPRGALVDDTELVAGLQQRLRDEGLPGDHTPLYVDDVEGVRVALLAPTSASGTLRWLTGPAGADPADLRVTGQGDPPSAPAAAVVVGGQDGEPVRLVVVAEGGAQVAVSSGIVVDPATGATRSTMRDRSSPDGVVALTLDRPTGFGVRVLVTPPGGPSTPLFPADDRADVYFPMTAGPDRPSRSGSAVASGAGYDTALSAITGATGWRPEDLDVRVLGAGTVPLPDGSGTEVVAVAAVLPSGAVLTATGTFWSATLADGSTSSSWGSCGGSAYPAGTDPAGLVVAATCLLGASTGALERTTVLFAPPGTDAVVLDTGTGEPVVSPTLENGFGWTDEVRRQDFLTATSGGVAYPVAGPGNDALQW
jgi:hypothetical protein